MPAIATNLRGDIDLSRRAVAFFQRVGLSPLPADPHRKGPLRGLYPSDWRSRRIPDTWWETPEWSGNIQLQLGRRTYSERKIAVVDLDGRRAVETEWPRLCGQHGACPSTWEVDTPSGGRHVYFELPDGVQTEDGVLWMEADVKHSNIHLLGEGKLAMAPPSRFGDNPAYRFAEGRGPRDLRFPAKLPEWITRLLQTAKHGVRSSNTCHSSGRPHRLSCQHHCNLDYLQEALSLGLQVFGTVNPRGWVKCRVPWRDDRNPSGSFQVESGILVDHAFDESYGWGDVVSLMMPQQHGST